jgi:hypothetical protein
MQSRCHPYKKKRPNMIPILTADSYRGFSAHLGGLRAGAEKAAQPVFIGRVLWPDSTAVEDVVIKLYEAVSCGVANETIGYIVNALRGVRQPGRGGILLLSKRETPDLNMDLTDFIDTHSGLAACWITSFEQNSQPFRYIRKLSSFSRKQSDAFYKSPFCISLATVDYVTGNNDRHEGNFLYEDDLKYFAIDQGCVGGGKHWHTSWPDPRPRNELAMLAQKFLNGSQLTAWRTAALMEYELAQSSWAAILVRLSSSLPGLLDADDIGTILEYLRGRATGPAFATSCERLI